VKSREIFETRFQIPCISSFAFLSFAIGVDSVGVVVGVMGKSFNFFTLAVIGAIGMFFGMLVWGYRIARTVGMNLTDLSPSRSFAAELTAGIVAMMFLVFSIPVSISQTLIGAIIGIGFARGRIEGGTMRDILMYWGVALPSAFILAFAFGMLL
jgi:PiT family inorganic phosphate transporter